MKIVNINYRGRVDKQHLPMEAEFRKSSRPSMLIYTCNNPKCKLLVFRSGLCRVMGCKESLSSTANMFPIPFKLLNILSVTATMETGYSINLLTLANNFGSSKALFEPEIFPAVRLIMFCPLCVNVFMNGKITILGLKTLCIKKICKRIRKAIATHYTPFLASASI